MTETSQIRASRALVFTQGLLGIGAYLTLALPYLRQANGLDRLRPDKRYLFVANHVSLLDTILLGALAWRSGCYPMLVLGDRKVWHASWLKRALSGPIGFLLERGKLNPGRIRELQAFARASKEFNLVVFPEGTRGDGCNVGTCQAGLFYIAQEAQVPIVPVNIQNMQFVSTKCGRFHALGGLRKVEVHYGEPIAPAAWMHMERENFLEFIRQRIAALPPLQPAGYLSPVLPPA
jgi:1-acyl-sn-glycerol-3-phosphate acyltransferase